MNEEPDPALANQTLISPDSHSRSSSVPSHLTRIIQSIRARPFRALIRLVILVSIGGCITLAGLNLWAAYHCWQADRLVTRQQYSMAYRHYSQCLSVRTRSASTHLLAARAARRAGMYAEAEQHLASCQRLRGSDPELTVPLALEHLLLEAQTGNINEVEDVLWAELKKKKSEAVLILEALAKGYARMLRMGAAMSCWRMLLEHEPDNVDALLNLGRLLEYTEPEEGLKKYRQALQLDAERDDVRLALAFYMLHHNPGEALSFFEDILTRQPDNYEAMLGLAKAYLTSPDSDRARPLLEKVLKHKPNDSRALTELGRLELASDRKSDAEALFRQAIAADRSNTDAHWELYGALLQQPGREAEAEVQRAVHKRVSDDRARLIQLAGKDMNQAPNDPNLLSEMGILFLRNGNPEVGLRWLYAALKNDPSHQASHQALYEHFKQIGDSGKAEMHRLQIRPGEAKSAPKSGG
jgi:uncharacterized protein HemY